MLSEKKALLCAKPKFRLRNGTLESVCINKEGATNAYNKSTCT